MLSWQKAACSLCLAAVACGTEVAPPDEATTHEVRFSRAGSVLATFRAFIADTALARSDGLSAIAPIGAGDALVLAFFVAQRVCIYNGPVAYPIDVAYIGEDATVVALENFAAGEEQSRCHDRVVDVVETRAGRLIDISLGDNAVITPPLRR